MLRPKRMSKVSVTGSKAVMGDVVEAVHDLHLVHLSDYDGHWEGFSNGNPMEGGDEASEKLEARAEDQKEAVVEYVVSQFEEAVHAQT